MENIKNCLNKQFLILTNNWITIYLKYTHNISGDLYKKVFFNHFIIFI